MKPDRVKKLDQEKEVYLGDGVDGEPVHTTKGDIEMSQADKEELSANISSQAFAGQINTMAEDVLKGATRFLEHTTLNIAPEEVVEAYRQGDGEKFSAWLLDAGIEFKQDGLISYVFRKGRELARLRAKVPPIFENAVENRIKAIHQSHV